MYLATHSKISFIPQCLQLCIASIYARRLVRKLLFASSKEMANNLQENSYLLTDSIMRLMIVAAITVPAVMVIIVVIHKKELHKFHYWFVINLMICDVITALVINPFYVVPYMIKLFSNVKVMMHCGCTFAFLYIAPISSGLMVLNLTVDAVLAIAFPLRYVDLMTKTKAIIMVAMAWMLAASLTLPLIASPELDVTVDNLSLCPYNIKAFLVLPMVRIVMAVAVIGFNIYLYWKLFKTKQKLKCLIEISTRGSSSRAHTIRSQLKKYKAFTRLSITLLLIIVVDGLLRILRVISIIIANENYFTDNEYFRLFFNLATWAEYINHPVVYGLMLREVYQSVFCKTNNNQNSLRS